ncbi:response regulator transcription factor [Eisenbergiella sp.]
MRRILLVEDEKMIRYGIYVMIENSGVPYSEITECRNGRDAVECLKRDRYDLVLTDIKMPVMSGLELSKWIYENLEAEERPLIAAISGYAEFEYVKGMMKFQAVDYLLKPVDREELGKILWHAEEILRAKGVESPEKMNCGSEAEVTGVSRLKMQRAVDYIRQNYGKPIDMAEVSNYVSMNYSMFSSTFKEYTGENFSTYLRKLRLEKSKKLLCNTDMSINEISQGVGFEDARRFAKVFKEETGMTPTACRDKMLAEKK